MRILFRESCLLPMQMHLGKRLSCFYASIVLVYVGRVGMLYRPLLSRDNTIGAHLQSRPV